MDIDRPTDLDAALAALAGSPDATLLAGGTDLMVEINFGHRRPEHIIALRRVEELKELNGTIGSGVSWARLERGPHRGLAQAARTVGSPQIRAAGTIGGNLATASPAGDGLPFLAAVDASVELRSATGSRRLRWDEFLTGPKQNALTQGELIHSIVLPDEMPTRQEFGKVGVRNAMVISAVMACVVRFEDGRTRVAVGSAGPTTLRMRSAEDLISDEANPSETALSEFQRLVSEEVRPITDHRSTEAYRRHAAGVVARRLLERCLV
ncbi:MAG: FAD binding domain-containing protein [Acidimicrobiia bacterium]|nr:FAD binding domain-containing protein [Acidimicrobiia bacterium]